MSDITRRLAVSSERLTDLLAQVNHDWVVVSGKMASGKDHVAALVNEALYDGQACMLRYGDLMRTELEPVLSQWRSAPHLSYDEAADMFARSLRIPRQEAAWAVQALNPDGGRFALSAWDRTNGIRQVLQALGGHWRADDNDYWARSAALAALRELPARPVLLTGGRFLPDVEIPRALGAITVRLDISAHTQRCRLFGRDGIEPDPDTLRHPGEVTLDEWPHFTARIDNNGAVDETVTRTVEAIRSHTRQ